MQIIEVSLMKKKIAVIFLVISAIPWIFAVGFGIYCSFAGFSLFAFSDKYYGLEGFFSGFVMLAVYWWFISIPTGIIVIVCVSYLIYAKLSEKKPSDK